MAARFSRLPPWDYGPWTNYLAKHYLHDHGSLYYTDHWRSYSIYRIVSWRSCRKLGRNRGPGIRTRRKL